MPADNRPYRSVLYIPGSKPRAIDKARGLAADAIVLDLEDAVGRDEKSDARATVAGALKAGGFGPRALIVRINGAGTDWHDADIAGLAAAKPAALLLPKVDRAEDIHAFEARLKKYEEFKGTRIWAMMETPAGMLNAGAIAAATPRMAGFVIGTNDLQKDIGARYRADRLPMLPGLGLCLLAARAAGLICVDGVYNAFKDEAGLAAECEQGRDMGFDGKTLIHPAQLAIANAAFAPHEDEVTLARRQIAAFASAAAEGKGIAVLDGRIVENLHVAVAEKLIARAEAIAALEEGQAA